MTREEIEELAALDALGALDEGDLNELDRACAADPEVSALRAGLHDTAAALAIATAAPAAAPEALRARVMGKIFGPDQLPAAATAGGGGFGGLARAAAVLILLLALGGVLAATGSRETVVVRDARSDAGAPFVALSGYGDFARSSASVLWDSGQRGWWIQAAGLPALPAGYSYRVWAVGAAAGRVYDCGPLPVGRCGTGRHFLAPPVDLDSMRGFAVSIERNGTDAGRPTSPAVLLTPSLKG